MDTERPESAPALTEGDETEALAKSETYVVDTEDEFMNPGEMDLEDMYATDERMERGGVPFKIGKVTFGLARAGGANVQYTRLMAKKTMPYRRVLQNIETNPDKLNEKTMNLLRRLEMETVAEACVKWWKHDDLGDNKLYAKEREILEFSTDNVMKLFKQMPAVFDALSERAKDLYNFKAAVEADAKN